MHYRWEYSEGYTGNVIYADAVMNGKKVELMGGQGASSQRYRLSLGDYQARLMKDPHKFGDTPLSQVWEIVLPDKTVWRCTVTGILE